MLVFVVNIINYLYYFIIVNIIQNNMLKSD